ncbi:ASCH domain-containing protein [Sporosarcina sp. P21c]|uniref:ASCH domain-containing protein n=1 Tax=Sporosarcina TaxID=1569 RepID=UPI000A165567|nr:MULTISPECIES: ASCH domain-containing protein [Sporosarcina]ARJ39371.1 RNA-binding protein [Sporosarcina ureae]PIC67621.1 ASCH domain-containing protein [Sporosarcina sp. P16a]PIC89333.1 ASCH domain-containing protein [Sporosarcina sp. P21c]PIC93072.1 ASCH domain-containing protein [Sporosarcina sp. P25]
MNSATQTYWDEYWGNQEKPQSVSAWQFGAAPDYLAQLVVDGIKTATCSGHIFYELENEPLPTTKDYNIILNSADQPVAITKTVEVTITPMNKVSEEFAIAEGEGDRTYRYWWEAHEEFFRKELHAIEREFSEDMLLVCERFEVIHVKDEQPVKS